MDIRKHLTQFYLPDAFAICFKHQLTLALSSDWEKVKKKINLFSILLLLINAVLASLSGIGRMGLMGREKLKSYDN